MSCVAPQWESHAQDDDIHFLPARCASVRGYQLLEKAFPQDVFACRAIFALERPDGTLTEDDFKLVDHIVGDLEKLRHDEPDLKINRISCFHDPFIGKRLLSQDFAVILMDVQMPTLDGYDTTALIRSREKSAHIPIIFITAHDDAVTRERITKSGAAGHLWKPFDEQAVLGAIRRAVGEEPSR